MIKVPHLKEKQDKTIVLEDKPFKVFISHSSEDIAFVNELVKLLEFLGVDSSEKLLCSSIKGYQIPTSEDFADYILKQFYDYNLFVIIVHSHNYYSSPYSLNEMGAAWVLKTRGWRNMVITKIAPIDGAKIDDGVKEQAVGTCTP